MDILNMVIDFMWNICNINIAFPDFNFKLWYFPAFGIIVFSVIKLMTSGVINASINTSRIINTSKARRISRFKNRLSAKRLGESIKLKTNQLKIK